MKSMILVFVVLVTISTQADAQSEHLTALINSEWERSMQENPTWASSLGDRRFNSQWADLSLDAIEKSHQKDVEVLQQLEKIAVEQLSDADQINYRLFRREYEIKVAAHQFRWYLVPLNQRGGIQDQGSLADALRFEKLKDFDDWLARMNSFPEYMDQTIHLMREGAKAGILHPKVVMQRVTAQIQKQIVSSPKRQLFYKPFFKIPDSISELQKKRLRREAIASIEQNIIPSYLKFLKFFQEEYLPASLGQVGVWQLPQGDSLYSLRCKEFTTTELTPTQIHSIGLAEVKRIRAEMQQIINDLEFEGSFDEFLEYLRTDPQFYFDNSNDLLRGYLAVCKRIDPQLVKLFKKLPRIPYGVEPIPPQLAPDTTTAYYRRPSSDGSRAGTYFVNLFRPEVRPKYEMEALSLHEAVPGHHLQIALAQELDELPQFRRYGGYAAYIEGWALYAESLGSELGLYQDPYSKFGQLTYEMWRAVRLVVDTGIHHQRWSRQQAIDFFAANTAKSLHDIENEIDRYISWPGQALAYKIGELKIQELRQLSEERLSDNFDIREFHHVILENGAVTLDILEDQVNDWIENQ
ncbi:DUF885 domain-containing protein [bacterium]|jgi:uncharacterized protein (DUF885 family)|nr:DUF885 domain-containing protein [Planctomicrobium sp.]MDA7527615.1 DUF885 domain-containing protein [bacterium]